jgi:hypothetical protein
MTISPTGIIPEELMYPARLGDVMAFLKAWPAPGDTKVEVFVGWARTVGVKVNGSQKHALYVTGLDQWQTPE